MTNLFYILISIILISCSQKSNLEKLTEDYKKDSTLNEIPLIYRYALSPDKSDLDCTRESERAKQDIKNGKLVFTQQIGLLSGRTSYI